MKYKRYYFGIEFRSDLANFENIRMTDLFYIAFRKLEPDAIGAPSSKQISIKLMQSGVKLVEIKLNKRLFEYYAVFYY